MNKRKVNKLRTVIIKACDAHIAAGGKIIDGQFTNYNENAYCPIGVVANSRMGWNWPETNIALKLDFDFTNQVIWSFIHGFDGIRFNTGINDRNLFDLGRELRKRYLTSKKRRQ